MSLIFFQIFPPAGNAYNQKLQIKSFFCGFKGCQQGGKIRKNQGHVFSENILIKKRFRPAVALKKKLQPF